VTGVRSRFKKKGDGVRHESFHDEKGGVAAERTKKKTENGDAGFM